MKLMGLLQDFTSLAWAAGAALVLVVLVRHVASWWRD